MHYIIDFKQDTTNEQIEEYFTQNSLTVIQVYNHFDLVYLVEGLASPPMTSIIESIFDDSEQTIVPLNYVYNAPADTSRTIEFDIQDNKNWWKTYSLLKVNFEEPQKQMKRKGRNTKVYILDSGINDSHPEFANTQINKLYTITNDFSDTSGHGTAIASLIAGESCGLTDASLQICKIFDVSVTTKLSQMLAALDSIATDFNNSKVFGGVINISWAIPKNIYVEQKLEQLINMGLMVVCSAGNNGTIIEDVTPACMEAVVTIGAYNQDFYPCDFSNYTASSISVTTNLVNWGSLDGWAPGIDIYVADLMGGYSFAAGTSLSAAIASGALVYNISKVYSDENDIPLNNMSEASLFSREFLSNHAIFRPGLLTLQGDYASSVNKVISYHLSTTDTNSKLATQALVHFKNGVTNRKLLYIMDNLKSVECTENLIPGLSFNMGWLIGNINVDLEGKNYKEFNYDFIFTSQDNEVVFYHLKLIVTENTLNSLSDVPDQDLQLTLQFLVGCNAANCISNCGFLEPFCVVCGLPKEQDCFCSTYPYISCP